MRIRKVHAVLAVSVALVVVARSVEARRRNHGISPVEPAVDGRGGWPASDAAPVAVAGEPGGAVAVAEPGAAADPVILADPVVVVEAAAAEPGAVPAALASAPKPRTRRVPLAMAAVVLVVIAALAGTAVAVAGAASSPAHQRVAAKLRH
jgi:hypothetical protein